jgi:hypothetical protein
VGHVTRARNLGALAREVRRTQLAVTKIENRL